MKPLFIGRENEYKALKEFFNSDRSEFIAVYGRRRVGKTFLVRTAAEDRFAFFVTGVHKASKSDQLINFAIALQRYSGQDLSVQKNWILAFYKLSQYLESLPEGQKVVFIDELPWMDTAKSGFIAALENFWNSWAALRKDIKLIVCGSATSWMINNLVRNRGGLHNRLTRRIVLEPFTLGECEAYFKAYGFTYSRKQIAECYMALGGVPYYMSLMDRSRSVAQNMDNLFFATNAPLRDEFQDLYRALYKNASSHIEVVTILATKGCGLTRQEILEKTGLTDNGAFTTVMEELEQCGFVRQYDPFGKTSTANDKRLKTKTLYQLIDAYTLFYFHFVRSNHFHDEHFWTLSLNSPRHSTWSGLAFEMLCLNHLPQIKKALGIAGVQTNACSWRSREKKGGAQIDLLLDRRDETINLCEIKYAKGEFEITAAYEERLQNKIRVFTEETATRKTLLLTLITTNGVKQNANSDIVQSEILLESLFN